MKTKYILIVIIWLTPCLDHAQSIGKKIKTINTKGLAQISVDRLGNFFLIGTNGTITKYDAQGKIIATLKHAHATLLEPWFHPIIFVYRKKSQTISTFGRYFENENITQLDPAWAITPQLACPTNDHKIWIYDSSDASLKKVNPTTQEVLFEFAIDTAKLNHSPNFNYLREYQSMLFLLDPASGIFIYNNIGKFINHIPIMGLQNFSFFGEELYYLQKNKIIFFDLYSEKQRSITVDGNYQFVLVTDEYILLACKKKGNLYSYKPLSNEK